MPDVVLAGCRSRPLIGYLKALGVLRAIGGQVDRSTRGRWTDGAFELRSDLTESDLLRFLLEHYAPAPVVSPWNGGSGFFPKDRQQAIIALENSANSRFAPYRETILGARRALAELGLGEKPEPPVKPALVRELRRRLPDAALPWLDAAIVVTGERVAYPPLLGSGGNDGRYDFANNYAQAVVHCLIESDPATSASLLSAALTGESIELQRKLSLGHLSRDSSPTNSPQGEADSLGSPWDLVLAIEGALLLVAGAARRLGTQTDGMLVAPFTVRATAAGYGSAVAGETGRAELWLPLWRGWASPAEVAQLARESRAQVGHNRSRRAACTGLDFARAAAELGVARGIDAFERYAILERAGQSNLAVAVGRVRVADSERPAARALDLLDPWLDRLLRFAAHDTCPGGVRGAIRRLERASFALAIRGAPGDACDTLAAIGAAEHALARSHAAIEGGIRPLRGVAAAPWLAAAADGSPEFEVAAALASLHDGTRRSPALRDYLHGTRRGGASFDAERRHALSASSPVALLAAIHARRHLDAAHHPLSNEHGHGEDRHQHAEAPVLAFDYGTPCELESARLLAAGLLDERRILSLLGGLALLDHPKFTDRRKAPSHERSTTRSAAPIYELLALAWMGRSLSRLGDERRRQLGPRPGWAARLAAGALVPVLADVLRRLQMAGLPSVAAREDLLTSARNDRQLGPRLGAALLLGLDRGALAEIVGNRTMPTNPIGKGPPAETESAGNAPPAGDGDEQNDQERRRAA
jgi:CRISPR-associated protein Csx17